MNINKKIMSLVTLSKRHHHYHKNNVTKKKPKKSNTPKATKEILWDRFIGSNYNDAPCPLCGINRISRNKTNGFEAAHIVADNFSHTSDPIYLVPSCRVCNLQCATICVLDYLFVRQRYTHLRKLCWTIFEAYKNLYPHEIEYHAGSCWKLIAHLYGPERFMAGGGIKNIKPIRNIIIQTQIDKVYEEQASLVAQLQEKSKLIQQLIQDSQETFKTPRYL